jgi:NAD(P)-dependent dehydrogenase (short-subunit alcohol dehydrogenase family)
VKGAIVNTCSASGTYLPNPGQANYGAAKAAISALSLVQAAELGDRRARELHRPRGAHAPDVDVPGMVGELMKKPEDPSAFDAFNPAHVSPLVAYLCREDCPLTGKVFAVQGGAISELQGWHAGTTISTDGSWTQEILERELGAAVAA